MPRDAVSRTANVERNGGQKWVKGAPGMSHKKFLPEVFKRVFKMSPIMSKRGNLSVVGPR